MERTQRRLVIGHNASDSRDSMITQLNPPLPMHTSKGDGWAHFVLDYGLEADLLWVVFMDADGACWSVPNSEVCISLNWSMGRRGTDKTSAVGTHEPAAPGAKVHRVFPRSTE